MSTWGDLTSELDEILGDTGAVSYPETLRRQSFNRAAQFFAITHTAPFTSVLATANSDLVVPAPTGLLMLAGIEDITDINNPAFLEPQVLIPGMRSIQQGYMLTSDGIKLFSSDYINLRIWYYGMYATATSGTSTIDLPLWAEWGVLNLGMAYMLNPNMVGQADLRRFQTRRDAGSPEDNPPRTQARYFLGVYNEVTSRVAPQDRSLLYHPGAR